MLHKITYALFGAGTEHCIYKDIFPLLLSFLGRSLYTIQNQEGVRFLVYSTESTRVGEGDRNPALVPSRFLLLFFSSNNNLSWNHTAYNIKIGVSAKHKTSQMWNPLLFSLICPCQGFLQERSRTKL